MCESQHGHVAVATSIEIKSTVLHLAIHCLNCQWSSSRDYDFNKGEYLAGCSAFAANESSWEVGWACEHGCGWMCHATRLEISVQFLRIAFACHLCHGKVTRYYDVRQHGYVDVTDHVIPNCCKYRRVSENATDYLGVQRCFRKLDCPVKSVRQLALSSSAMDNIDGLANAAAKHCSGMTYQELRHCFWMLFPSHPDELLEPFVNAYRRSCEELG